MTSGNINPTTKKSPDRIASFITYLDVNRLSFMSNIQEGARTRLSTTSIVPRGISTADPKQGHGSPTIVAKEEYPIQVAKTSARKAQACQ